MSTRLMTEKSSKNMLEVQSSWGGQFKGMCIDLFIRNGDYGNFSQYQMDRSCAENLVKCIQEAYAEADKREFEKKKSELANTLVHVIGEWDEKNQWIADRNLLDTVELKDKILEIIG